MVCETKLKPRQTISERAQEVREATARLAAALAAGRVKITIGVNGVPVFTGWDPASRDGITDACALRQIMKHGNATTRMAIQMAEKLSGRKVNMQLVGQGLHSHDGGATWHTHKR